MLRAVAEVLRQVEVQAVDYPHKFSGPAQDEMIASEERHLGMRLHPEHRKLLKTWNGARLFEDGLDIYCLNSGRPHSLRWAMKVALNEGYPYEKGLVPFAEIPQTAILWAYDTQGVVRGLGREGVTYGPHVPFATWFADQITDLRYLWVHREELSWADTCLFA